MDYKNTSSTPDVAYVLVTKFVSSHTELLVIELASLSSEEPVNSMQSICRPFQYTLLSASHLTPKYVEESININTHSSFFELCSRKTQHFDLEMFGTTNQI